MKFYFAPMEGVTGSLYRRHHHKMFPGIDRYYIPFLEPREGKGFDGHDRREIDPKENRGVPVVPQLLTNRADRFLEAAEHLKALGYQEVNLNLGCPARTVVTKRRGSGLLDQGEMLVSFLDEIFEKSPLPISIKTRLGVRSEEEWEPLLELYRRYPMTELIIHARVTADQYNKPVRREAFGKALGGMQCPICYNGDLFSVKAIRDFEARFPQVDRLMLGRGLIANPGLVREYLTGQTVTGQELKQFHDQLFREYRSLLSGDKNVIHWMKELWFYMGCLFPSAAKELKSIRKAQRLDDYQSAADRIFSQHAVVTEPGYQR